MANYSYCCETGEDSCDYFDYEPSPEEIDDAIIDIAYEEFFMKHDDTKEIEAKTKKAIRNLISELDLWSAVKDAMDYNDMIKDYFENEAFSSLED